MSLATPKSIANDLIDRLNNLNLDALYLDENSKEVKILFSEARSLMNVDPSEANVALAAIYQLCNNPEKVKNHVGIANNLPTMDSHLLHYNSSVALANIGLYSESQKYYTQIVEPNSIESHQVTEGGYGSLSISKLNELFIKAESMKLTLDNDAVELTQRAAAVLKKCNVTDSILAQYADVFGSVLRENKLMIKGSNPDINVGDMKNGWHPETVFITFKVQTDPLNAAKLYREGTKRLISKFKTIPEAVHFSVEAY